MRTTTWIAGSVAIPSPRLSVGVWLPCASSSQKTGPSAMNALATVRAAVTKPPGLPRRSTISLVWPLSMAAWTASTKSVRAVLREAGEADVADRPVGVVRGDDLALVDDVARDRDVERGPASSLDRQRHRGALLAPDPVPRLVGREPIQAGAVHLRDHVAGLQAGLLGRRSFDRGDDDEPAVRAELRAVGRLAGAVHRSDLGTDPLELARDVLERQAELLGREVRGIRVADRLDHASDRALDDRLAIDRAPARIGRGSAWYASQKGWNASSSVAGVPGWVAPRCPRA